MDDASFDWMVFVILIDIVCLVTNAHIQEV